MKKVLITGANGFLGQHLTLFLSKYFLVFATSRGENRNISFNGNFINCDLTDKEAVIKLIEQVEPNIIIHTAAMSKPDECLQQPQLCVQNNINATINLIEACKLLKINIFSNFIFTSTDFIFGENGPHSEDDKPNPLNFYGETKLIAEKFLKSCGLPYTIVRPVFIYGPKLENGRNSFVQNVVQQLTVGKKMKLVNDQYRTPTYVYDICKGFFEILNQAKTGIYHFAGNEIITPYNMALLIANIYQLDKNLLIPVDEHSFPEPVKRAKQGGLLNTYAKESLSIEFKGLELAITEIAEKDCKVI